MCIIFVSFADMREMYFIYMEGLVKFVANSSLCVVLRSKICILPKFTKVDLNIVL